MEGASMPLAPLAAAEFDALMARFAPFEDKPHLAIACSGGADSLALVLLADRWARAQGGALTVLTVDHRLRPESTDEAAAVGAMMAARGIAHEVLQRDGPPPPANIEGAARAARYELLERWCAAQGVLHLLTAHHREDQAETFLIRLARGSGVDGLSGMAGESARRNCRLLRPLLGVEQGRLAATVAATGLVPIEDAMNRDAAYQRVRLRSARGTLEAEGLTTDRLAATAGRLGRARAALEIMTAELLARSVALYPEGYALVDAAALVAAPAEAGLRALAATLGAVGGGAYPPRLENLERLLTALGAGLAGARTLSGCLAVPKASGLLICRESAAIAAPVPAPPGASLHWDHRFAIAVPAAAAAGLAVGALGPSGAAQLGKAGWGDDLPATVRVALPAFFDAAGLAAVPAFGWRRNGFAGAVFGPENAVFRSLRSLASLSLRVV